MKFLIYLPLHGSRVFLNGARSACPLLAEPGEGARLRRGAGTAGSAAPRWTWATVCVQGPRCQALPNPLGADGGRWAAASWGFFIPKLSQMGGSLPDSLHSCPVAALAANTAKNQLLAGREGAGGSSLPRPCPSARVHLVRKHQTLGRVWWGQRLDVGLLSKANADPGRFDLFVPGDRSAFKKWHTKGRGPSSNKI